MKKVKKNIKKNYQKVYKKVISLLNFNFVVIYIIVNHNCLKII